MSRIARSVSKMMEIKTKWSEMKTNIKQFFGCFRLFDFRELVLSQKLWIKSNNRLMQATTMVKKFEFEVKFKFGFAFEMGDNTDRHTCRNGRMAPLMRNESAAMPAIPSAGSRNCRKDIFGATWPQLYAQQITLLASGCELCRMIREPEFGDDVIRTGGMCCCTFNECGDKWPCAWLRTLSFDT